MQDLTEEEIAELKAKHGDPLRAVEALNAWLVFRKPTRHEYDRYTDKLTGDQAKMRSAAWELAQACIVAPDKAALTAAMDAEPTILIADILPALNDMAGDGREKRTVKI